MSQSNTSDDNNVIIIITVMKARGQQSSPLVRDVLLEASIEMVRKFSS